MKLFISYAHQDEALRGKLNIHLRLLEREGIIKTWHDRNISAGTEWAQEIDRHLNAADIILLLVSADFIGSEYCYEIEMQRALDLHNKKVARVIPIILRSCDWESAPFGKLQALPVAHGRGTKPVTRWDDEDEAFTEIVKGIRKVAAEINQWTEEIQLRCRQKMLGQHSTIGLLSGDTLRVDQLYVDVWLLNRSPRTYQVSESKLLELFDLRNDRLGLGDRIGRNEGIKVANDKTRLLILGKPGSGKTTFLKHLAVDCSNKKFQPDLIPVLIELRRIQSTEWSLLDTISSELGVDNRGQTQRLLEQGKLLILMDGLDEVSTSEFRRNVQEQVLSLSQEPQYSDNRFILTCRTQIIEVIPKGFTSVEVADFNDEQVERFVKNWFHAIGQSELQIIQRWQAFADAIQNNSALKELTVTPVLLSLMCLVLQDAGELPSQTALLYRKGIRLLLEKWNDRKEIPEWEVGNEVYRKLEPDQKEKLLTEIAARKFENPENFVLFEQKDLAKQISNLLKLENVREGEAVLKAIEAQHGLLVERADELWSFSHLTFQEYFTAQWLNQLQQDAGLAEKITDKRWQAVVTLAIKSQQPADRLLRLIKQAIDYSISQDVKVQILLTWVQEKVEVIDSKYKPASIRALYLALALACAIDLALILNLDSTFARNFEHNLTRTRQHIRELTRQIFRTLGFAYTRALIPDSSLAQTLNLAYNLAYDLASDIDMARALDPGTELERKLQHLWTQLPKVSSKKNRLSFQHWWTINAQAWTEELHQVTIMYRHTSNDWRFTESQKQLLQRYHDANKFLVELLKEPGAISNTVRQEIEDNLLLPIATLRERLPEMYGER